MKQAALSFAGRASNPTKASPAQLAARKRFAEMARSGAFKKATKRKANPGTSMKTINDYRKALKNMYGVGNVKITKYGEIHVKGIMPNTNQFGWYLFGFINDQDTEEKIVFNNPAKKTVNQKISQLVHEGYPQRQAVAVALSEQRAGKVKRNPTTKMQDIYFVSIMNQDGLQYGVDRHTPVTYTFSAKEPKKAYRSFGLPFNVTSNPKFQEFAKRNKTIVASLNEIIEMMQGFAK